jgi:hypothetical protein
VRVRILASGPLGFKAAVPLVAQVSAHQGHRTIRKVEELLPYFMFSKIAFSGYKGGEASLISCDPNNGCMSL